MIFLVIHVAIIGTKELCSEMFEKYIHIVGTYCIKIPTPPANYNRQLGL